MEFRCAHRLVCFLLPAPSRLEHLRARAGNYGILPFRFASRRLLHSVAFPAFRRIGRWVGLVVARIRFLHGGGHGNRVCGRCKRTWASFPVLWYLSCRKACVCEPVGNWWDCPDLFVQRFRQGVGRCWCGKFRGTVHCGIETILNRLRVQFRKSLLGMTNGQPADAHANGPFGLDQNDTVLQPGHSGEELAGLNPVDMRFADASARGLLVLGQGTDQLVEQLAAEHVLAESEYRLNLPRFGHRSDAKCGGYREFVAKVEYETAQDTLCLPDDTLTNFLNTHSTPLKAAGARYERTSRGFRCKFHVSMLHTKREPGQVFHRRSLQRGRALTTIGPYSPDVHESFTLPVRAATCGSPPVLFVMLPPRAYLWCMALLFLPLTSPLLPRPQASLLFQLSAFRG